MRICFFGIDLTSKRGVNNLSLNLIKNLAQDSDVDQILVICDSIDEDAYKMLKCKKVNLQLTGWVKRSDFLRVFIRNVRYLYLPHELKTFDVIHVLDDRAFPFVYTKIHPLIVTIHNAMIPELFSILDAMELVGISGLPGAMDLHLPQVFLEFLSVKKANEIIVNSPIIAQRLEKLYGNLSAKKINVIPPGFDEKEFNPFFETKSEAKKLLGLDPSSRVLLHVGGSLERKGFPYLLHAINHLQKTGELERLNILLLVVGGVKERWFPMLSKVKEHVIELSYVPKDLLPNVYRAADLFVMPSISEGWGMALVEALACGTPVIASPNVPSAVALKNLSAVQIEPTVSNPTELGASICSMLEKNPLELHDQNEIFNMLVLRFSWKNYARCHIEIYKRLTKN